MKRSAPAVFLLAAALFSGTVRASEPAAARPPNVILLIVDDLRADRLGAYGGPRGLSPRFDALARESSVFENAFAQAGWTLPSVSSIMTGLYPTVHGAFRALPGDWPVRLGRGRLRLQPGNSLPPTRLTLAEALRRRGYRTEAVVSCPFGDPVFGFGAGFDRYDHSGGYFPDVNAAVARRLADLRDGPPFFLYVHVIDAHVGAGEGEETADLSPERRREELARYDVQVSSADAGLGVLLESLRAGGLLDRSVLIVTADHGEEFGEHGRGGHGSSPYDTALRVPLFLRRPGGTAARRVAAPVESIDLFPTVLDLAGLPPEPGVQGASLRPALEGKPFDRTAYSEIYPHTPPFNDALLAVSARTADWKYVWRPEGGDELYRVRDGREETHDVSSAEPERAREFRRRIEEWRAIQGRAAAALPALPGAERFLPADEAARLRKAGYLPAAAAAIPRPVVPFAAPADAAIPAGPDGDEIRYGLSLATATRTLLPRNDPSGLNCASCHLDAGRTAFAAPWVGLESAFPLYFKRDERVITLSERIHDCFERSLNGRAPEPDSREMKALTAYIGWLSRGVPPGADVRGRGFAKLAAARPPDPRRGERLFGVRCAKCHGTGGEGQDLAGGGYRYPPLWGPRSFNIGASMARTGTAAAFIRRNMPRDDAGALTDEQAFDVAEFVTHQPRPDFPGKAADWPKGGKPADARY